MLETDLPNLSHMLHRSSRPIALYRGSFGLCVGTFQPWAYPHFYRPCKQLRSIDVLRLSESFCGRRGFTQRGKQAIQNVRKQITSDSSVAWGRGHCCVGVFGFDRSHAALAIDSDATHRAGCVSRLSPVLDLGVNSNRDSQDSRKANGWFMHRWRMRRACEVTIHKHIEKDD
jgi:hypothetical protein